MNAIEQATELINRAKNLIQFKVVVQVPDDFEFRGVVPYDLSIQNGIMTFKVYALTLEEAQEKVREYLDGSRSY